MTQEFTVFGAIHQPPVGTFIAPGLSGCTTGGFADNVVSFSPSGARLILDRTTRATQVAQLRHGWHCIWRRSTPTAIRPPTAPGGSSRLPAPRPVSKDPERTQASARAAHRWGQSLEPARQQPAPSQRRSTREAGVELDGRLPRHLLSRSARSTGRAACRQASMHVLPRSAHPARPHDAIWVWVEHGHLATARTLDQRTQS
jgi:hypothetical protein